MNSLIIFGIMCALFIVGVYGVRWWIHRRQKSIDVTHSASPVAVVVLIPLAVGILLVSTVFGKINRKPVRTNQNQHEPRIIPIPPLYPPDAGVPVLRDAMSPPSMSPPKPDAGAPALEKLLPQKLKVVISDDSVDLDKALARCRKHQVVIIRKGKVRCARQNAPSIRAWHQFQRKVEERMLLQQKPKTHRPSSAMKNGSPFGFIFAAPTGTDNQPFKDKYAEIFYFLALVLGVLSKYYWDYIEAKKRGDAADFEPHVIVASFIVAALVYYSIQQGLEQEAGKLTMRGALFAFQNGFMWQSVTSSLRGRQNGGASASEEKPEPQTSN